MQHAVAVFPETAKVQSNLQEYTRWQAPLGQRETDLQLQRLFLDFCAYQVIGQPIPSVVWMTRARADIWKLDRRTNHD
jgi:hypothetical protein